MNRKLITILVIGSLLCATFPQSALARWHDKSDSLPGMEKDDDDAAMKAAAIAGGVILVAGIGWLITYIVKKNKENNSVTEISSRQSEFSPDTQTTTNVTYSRTLTGKQPPSLYRYDWTFFDKASIPAIKLSLRDSNGQETSEMNKYLSLNNLSF